MNGDWTRSSYFVQMFGYPPMTLLQIFNPAFDMETVKMLMGIYVSGRALHIDLNIMVIICAFFLAFRTPIGLGR